MHHLTLFHLTLFLLAISPTALAAAAQTTTTTSFLNLNFDNPPYASILASTSSTITLSLTCAPTIAPTDCGIPANLLLTQAPGSQRYAYSDALGAITLSEACQLTGTTAAFCTVSVGGTDANEPGVVSAAVTGSDVTFSPITITAGLEKLAGGVAGTGTGTGMGGAGAAATAGAGSAAAATETRVKATSSASVTGSSTTAAAAAAASQTSSGGAAGFAGPGFGVAGVLAAAAWAL
ncbi:hypothetical protein K490DRAFT_65742 [Saccharata proteae CBS 121410]|uniref:GPI anchored cell wall protein n=1 Tax=Saccharata proteae CBS 121410 TaxID=1314787 RepID=A0A9P4HY40_9PEZI|nr:hypothetical protein K490DRAFT_65742 [Saccharata proteae CBS 121410]